MIKELLLAAFIGGILGFGVTGGYLTLQNKNSNSKPNTVITEPTLIPTQTETPPETEIKPVEGIQIDSPENNSLVTTSKTDLTGISTPNSHIVVVTPSNSFVGQSDSQGKFNISISLDSGLNLIKISAIDTDGNQKDTQINLTYSTAKI